MKIILDGEYEARTLLGQTPFVEIDDYAEQISERWQRMVDKKTAKLLRERRAYREAHAERVHGARLAGDTGRADRRLRHF